MENLYNCKLVKIGTENENLPQVDSENVVVVL